MNDTYKITQEDLYLFHEGTNYKSYSMLGAKKVEGGVLFSTWCKDAQGVAVMGDFNGWNKTHDKLEKISEQGVWSLFVKGAMLGDRYKFVILTRQGQLIEKSDPYGFYAELPPSNCSIVCSLDFHWNDNVWQNKQLDHIKAQPINIYEFHMGSWKRKDDGSFYTYRELAELLIPYVKEMGYTHIEMMPILEYPYEGSWGYQVTGYFASSSRYGKPQDLMYLIDLAHQFGIGVILDWVPAHFPKDGHGLALFDGTSCYEYDDALKAEHEEWGTKIFDYSKKEVQSFLVSSAMFWIEKYHIDGIRVDAVSSMLYLDYGRSYTRWTPNIYNGNHNLEAIDFLKKLNTAIATFFPKTIMIAEESSCFGGVTKAADQGGLGFDFKWNMGWMNDSLRYISYDPIFRQYHHIDITHAMDYQYSENYILPLSHDEVVHLKKSMLSKMSGTTPQKFGALRCFLAFMIAHPGKKLTFMGCEIGQWSEWNYKKALDWNLLEFDTHKKLQTFVKSINHFYKTNDAFWQLDHDQKGFRWIVGDDNKQNVVIFSRRNQKEREILCIFNFSPNPLTNYRVGVPENKAYHEIFSSNWIIFNGNGIANNRPILAQEIPLHGQNQSIEITIPGNTALFLK